MIHETIPIRVKESEFEGRLITYIHDSSVEISDYKRPMVVVCPGGGYSGTSDREAEPIALQYVAMGYHAAVLRYSTAPARFPEALRQLAAAIALLRERTEPWRIDTEKILVQGFSAGGHLAASLGVFWKQPFAWAGIVDSARLVRPNGLILAYPVITSGEKGHQGSFQNLLGSEYGDSEKRASMSLERWVTEDTPPTFLWHTATDRDVPVENSLLFFAALKEKNVPVEMHIYPTGKHGLALATKATMTPDGGSMQPECKSWISLVYDWIHYTFEREN